MTLEELFREWRALPPHAQQQVADFIAFLHDRYETTDSADESTSLDLNGEPYVGMWKDRPDMADSDAWVRSTRRREWTG